MKYKIHSIRGAGNRVFGADAIGRSMRETMKRKHEPEKKLPG
jgi:Ni,Fe-hydrogenase maturation factor